jgi:hypothetical protein
MALKRWEKGKPIDPNADTWNAFCDNAEANGFESRAGGDAKGTAKNSCIITIKNNSGEDRDRFDVLQLDTPLITKAQNENEFKNRVAFNAVDYTGDADETPVILMQPLADGQTGRGVILGATIANVEILDGDHKYATFSSDHPEYLESSGSGSIKLLYNPGTGDDLAVILLGSSGSNIVFAVLTEDLEYGDTADALEYTTVSPLGGVSTGNTLPDLWCPLLLPGKKFSSTIHVLVDKSQGNMVINSMECPVAITP